MAYAAVTADAQANLVQAGKLNKTQRNSCVTIAERIKNINEVQANLTTAVRGKPGDGFRLDVRALNGTAANGAMPTDYKVEIQNNGATTLTFGIVFVAQNAPNTSLADFVAAVEATLQTQRFYRVT